LRPLHEALEETAVSTDVWDDIGSVEEKVPRDRWQRPLIVPASGGKAKAYTRVTTFASSVEDMFSLGQWQQRMVALGLSRRPDLLLSVSAHAEDKDELNRIVDSAREAAAASAAATVGTALHKLTERLDRGEMSLDAMPDSHRSDMKAYADAMAPLKIRGVEQFVVLDDLQVAGTFDRIVEYDGQRYTADVKTGSIEYGVGKMAIQLALYSRGHLYAPGRADRGGTEVNQNAGIIIHLPAGQGRCDLYWIDLRAGWEAVRLCADVRAWRKRKNLLTAASFATAVLAPPAQQVEPSPTMTSLERAVTQAQAEATLAAAFPRAEALALEEQIKAADSNEELERIWSQHREAWTAEHTKAAAARKLALHQRILRRAAVA
jgi:predicted RecB family endonuclease